MNTKATPLQSAQQKMLKCWPRQTIAHMYEEMKAMYDQMPCTWAQFRKIAAAMYGVKDPQEVKALWEDLAFPNCEPALEL